MTMSPIARATTWRNSTGTGIRRSPSRSHSCLTVANPIVAIVNNPTHLHDTTAPRLIPHSVNHAHHRAVNARAASSFEKPTQRNAVNAVKKISGESRRISRDWVINPFSNVTSSDASIADVGRQLSPRIVRYASGTSATPSDAGTIRIAT